MRPEDIERLSEPFPPDADPDARFAQALGVYVPSVMTLHREILGDLDPVRHGVGWWSPQPGTSRRILISDHLLLSVLSVQTSLHEAKLHLLELLDAWQQTTAFYADMLRLEGQEVPSSDSLRRTAALSGRPRYGKLLAGEHQIG
jgi:hypothetical protein